MEHEDNLKMRILNNIRMAIEQRHHAEHRTDISCRPSGDALIFSYLIYNVRTTITVPVVVDTEYLPDQRAQAPGLAGRLYAPGERNEGDAVFYGGAESGEDDL